MVFDIPDPDLEIYLSKRLAILIETVKVMQEHDESHAKQIQVVKYKPIGSRSCIQKRFKEVVAKGGEGLILRNLNSYYEIGVSNNILKYKPVSDSEAVIIGYKEGNGKFQGLLGAFLVEDYDKPDIKYSVSGVTLDIRKNYLTTHPKGTIISVHYNELTSTGKPRFPRYKGIRSDPKKKDHK